MMETNMETNMRNDKGQFIKGERYSQATEFKPGQHWRKHKPFWDREWLVREYCDKQRSSTDIAAEFGVTNMTILFWLNKHKIPTRGMKENRAIKHWGASGEANPMYGKRGSQVPNWKGGITPERQAFYSSLEWADAVKAVWERDKGICQRCGAESTNRRKMHIHHIVHYSVKELIAEPSNLVLLCSKCHPFVHSKKNVNREFIAERKEVRNGNQ